MRNMSYKIKCKFNKVILVVGVVVLLNACGSTEEKPFVPPVYPSPPDPARFIYERTLISSNSIKELTSSEKFQLMATGSIGAATGLGKPYGVAVYKGRVYVSDTVLRGVAMFDVPTGQFKLIGTEGVGALAKPLGLDVSDDGDLYVADGTSKRVAVFNKSGDFIQAIGSSKELKRPSGVALSPDNKLVYVVDTGGVDSDQHRVYVYDTVSGDLVRSFGGRGTGPGEFNLPLQAAVGKDGTIYVVDSGNFRVKAFTPNGEHKLSWGQVGKQFGNFSRPKGVGVDAEGNVYVADAAFGNVQIFNEKGELLMFMGSRGNAGGPGEFSLPAGVTVDEDGRVYMVDQYFRKVDVFRPAALTEADGYLGSRYREQVEAEQKAQNKR